MAETWVAGSRCRLVHVPWDSQYQKVVQFESAAARDAYLDSLDCVVNLEITDQTYIRPNTPLVVDAAYSAVYGANYLLVDNPAQPVEGARAEQLFYFITDTQYAAPHSTRLILQLDVWQTRFMSGATLGSGFLERGHLPVNLSYHAATTPSNLRRYCTAPEGIDIGADYVNHIYQLYQLQSGDGYICVVSTADLSADPGTVSAPNLETATGQSTVDGLPSGAMAYLIDADRLRTLLSNLAKYPWVAQNIVSMYYIPEGVIDSNLTGGAVNIADGNVTAYTSFGSKTGITWTVDPVSVVSGGYSSTPDLQYFKKLYCYPYAAIELFANQGSPTLLKPELVNSSSFTMDAMLQLSDFRICFYPTAYANTGSGITNTYNVLGNEHDDFISGTWLDNAVWMGDPATFATVNNSAVLSLASTANTRAYSYQAAGWQAARSTAANRAALEQSNMGLATQAANQQLQNELINTQQGLSGIGGAVGALGAFAGGNLLGGAAALGSTALGYLSSEASQQTQISQFRNTQNLQADVADMNYRLGQYMTQSNEQQAIAAIEASVSDTELTPPSVVGQQGGSLFNLRHGLICAGVRSKTLPEGALNRVLQYFKRWGYAYNQWVQMPQNLQVMSDFSYWRVLDLTLDCATANETEAEAIRGIFARGVTVFTDPDVLTSYDVADNRPI